MLLQYAVQRAAFPEIELDERRSGGEIRPVWPRRSVIDELGADMLVPTLMADAKSE